MKAKKLLITGGQGMLATDLARAGARGSNKGTEAMLTALEMVNLFKEMGKTP